MNTCKCGCGQECKKEYVQWHHRRGKPSPNKGKHQVAWNKGIPQTPEQRKKNSESKKGRIPWNKGVPLKEKSSFWFGGTKIFYAQGLTKRICELIRNRDNHECQLCHKKESGLSRKLEVHHIDCAGHNHSPENLISLCRSCHIKAHRKNNPALAET